MIEDVVEKPIANELLGHLNFKKNKTENSALPSSLNQTAENILSPDTTAQKPNEQVQQPILQNIQTKFNFSQVFKN